MNELLLAVDDNQQILNLLSLILRRAGFRVATAVTGAEARAALADEFPALAILDMSLPDTTGLELLEFIRETSNIPVIILSAMEETSGSVGKVSGVRFVVKPFDPAELIANIKQAIQTH